MNFQLPLMPPFKDLVVHIAIWATLLVILQLAIAAFPNGELDSAVRAKFPNQVHVVLAAKSAFSGSHTSSQRGYILLPRFLSHPSFVEARKVDSAAVAVTENGEPAAITGIVFLIGSSIYFGRRWRRYGLSRTQHAAR